MGDMKAGASGSMPAPVVRYAREDGGVPCPYGTADRIITGGLGGIANVHVIRATRGDEHYHSGYHEVYFVLSGHGEISLDGEVFELRPGAAVTIPSGVVHALKASPGEVLQFVIFGTPAMSVEDERFLPRDPKRT